MFDFNIILHLVEKVLSLVILTLLRHTLLTFLSVYHFIHLHLIYANVFLCHKCNPY